MYDVCACVQINTHTHTNNDNNNNLSRWKRQIASMPWAVCLCIIGSPLDLLLLLVPLLLLMTIYIIIFHFPVSFSENVRCFFHSRSAFLVFLCSCFHFASFFLPCASVSSCDNALRILYYTTNS